MTTKPNDGGPVFPVSQISHGMTLRDHATLELMKAIISTDNERPFDSEWPDILRRAKLGADTFIAGRGKP